MLVQIANISDHKSIYYVASRSKYTRGFSNRIYSGPKMYARGWIGVYRNSVKKTVGFVCLRHGTRNGWTTIYDLGVLPEYERRGIGSALAQWALNTSPHKRVHLNVDRSNERAILFYTALGYRRIGDGVWKSGQQYLTLERQQ